MTETGTPSAASKMALPPAVALPLGSLVPNPAYQPRGLSYPAEDDLDDAERWQDNLDPDQLESLRASAQETWPPLLVAPSEGQPGQYDLLDGFHRYAIALEHAQGEIPASWEHTPISCRILEHGGIDIAIAANICHGLPLSLADRKAAACLYHQLNPEMSYRQLAAKVGLSDKTVKTALLQATAAQYPPAAEEAPSTVRRSPDPIEKVIKLVVAASHERTGTNWLARLFSHKTEQQQQVEYVARVIGSYSEQDEIAHDVVDMGQVLIAGAQHCLGETQQQSTSQVRM